MVSRRRCTAIKRESSGSNGTWRRSSEVIEEERERATAVAAAAPALLSSEAANGIFDVFPTFYDTVFHIPYTHCIPLSLVTHATHTRTHTTCVYTQRDMCV